MSAQLRGTQHWEEAEGSHGPVVACPRCGVKRKMRNYEPEKPCWDCKVLMEQDAKRRKRLLYDDEERVRYEFVGDASSAALEERLWELNEHDFMLANDPGYRTLVEAGIQRDPRSTDPDAEWDSIGQIEDELARRER